MCTLLVLNVCEASVLAVVQRGQLLLLQSILVLIMITLQFLHLGLLKLLQFKSLYVP